MTHYTYLIIGGGMTGDAATRGIREVDPNGSIGLISAESDPPYKRPPLSKGLWQGKAFESIWSKTESRGVALHLGRSVRSLNLLARQATDDRGAVSTYDKLHLATGGTVRRLPVVGARTIYFRTVEDFRHLRALADRAPWFAVNGAGSSPPRSQPLFARTGTISPCSSPRRQEEFTGFAVTVLRALYPRIWLANSRLASADHTDLDLRRRVTTTLRSDTNC